MTQDKKSDVQWESENFEVMGGLHQGTALGTFLMVIDTLSKPNWDANSWQDVLFVDTNSLRHLTKRLSTNCDLQFANCHRQI